MSRGIILYFQKANFESYVNQEHQNLCKKSRKRKQPTSRDPLRLSVGNAKRSLNGWKTAQRRNANSAGEAAKEPCFLQIEGKIFILLVDLVTDAQEGLGPGILSVISRRGRHLCSPSGSVLSGGQVLLILGREAGLRWNVFLFACF